MNNQLALAAILLAAGKSKRFGANKLLSSVAGEPVIARVTKAILRTEPPLSPIVVVTGHEQKRLRQALEGFAVNFVHNSHYEQGLSTSLRVGIKSLPPTVLGAVVCLGDMPLITSRHIERLIESFNPNEKAAICVPVVGRRRGNPTLWSARFFTEMTASTGDAGARHLISDYASELCEVPFDDDGPIFDVDKPEDFAMVSERNNGTP